MKFIVFIILITFLYISKELSIGGIFQSTMNKLKKKHRFNMDVWKKVSVFAKCIVCESLKDLISKLEKNNSDVKKYELKLKKHILHQESYISLYHIWRSEFVCDLKMNSQLYVIHDKMDLNSQGSKRPTKWFWVLENFLLSSWIW
jgi:Na+/phosphate symporter